MHLQRQNRRRFPTDESSVWCQGERAAAQVSSSKKSRSASHRAEERSPSGADSAVRNTGRIDGSTNHGGEVMSRVRVGIAVWVFLEISACAFKPGEESPAVQAPPTASLVKVSWWTADQKKSQPLSRGLEHLPDAHLMHLQTPVTIPAQVPDRVEIELSYPTRFANLTSGNLLVQALGPSGQVTQLNPTNMTVLSQTDDWTDALVDLEGIRKLLSDSKEQMLDFRFLIQKPSGEAELTIVVSLRTPPALLTFAQRSVEEADLEGLQTKDRIRVLDLEGERYRLLQVTTVRNYSGAPVELRIPSTIGASLRIERTSYHVQAAGECGFDATMDKAKVVVRGKVRVLPFSDELIRWASTSDLDRLSKAVIASNQEGRFGIYVSGEDAAAIADGRFQRESRHALGYRITARPDVNISAWEQTSSRFVGAAAATVFLTFRTGRSKTV